MVSSADAKWIVIIPFDNLADVKYFSLLDSIAPSEGGISEIQMLLLYFPGGCELLDAAINWNVQRFRRHNNSLSWLLESWRSPSEADMMSKLSPSELLVLAKLSPSDAGIMLWRHFSDGSWLEFLRNLRAGIRIGLLSANTTINLALEFNSTNGQCVNANTWRRRRFNNKLSLEDSTIYVSVDDDVFERWSVCEIYARIDIAVALRLDIETRLRTLSSVLNGEYLSRIAGVSSDLTCARFHLVNVDIEPK